MSLNRAFTIPFAVALIGEVIAFFIHYDSVLGWSIFWSQYFLIALTGFLLGRAERSVGFTMKAVLPFAVLGLLSGLLNLLSDRGETPSGWPSDEDQRALLGFLLGWSVFLLPSALAVGFIGRLGSVLLSKHQRNAAV